MSTDIRNKPNDQVVLYQEDDGGVRLAQTIGSGEWRNLHLSANETMTLRNALNAIQAATNPTDYFHLNTRRKITLQTIAPDSKDAEEKED